MHTLDCPQSNHTGFLPSLVAGRPLPRTTPEIDEGFMRVSAMRYLSFHCSFHLLPELIHLLLFVEILAVHRFVLLLWPAGAGGLLVVVQLRLSFNNF